jgi:8-oxo-dGTP pyrophosphatase MutT (NUDIX family)
MGEAAQVRMGAAAVGRVSTDPSAAPSLTTPSELTRRLRTVFASRHARKTGGLRAAVAIVVCPHEGALGLLLTRRASTLRSHAGQYALPGGRLEEGEAAEEAALREVREEIGLELSADEVVGRLPDYRTRSGYRITPIVVWATELGTITPNGAEVDRVFHVPLSKLRGPAVPTLLPTTASSKPIIQMPLGGDRMIHAPTGAILHQFAEAALGERYVDAQSFEEPTWAHR